MDHRRVGASFYGWLIVVGVMTYLVHEAAHWIAGSALGYPVAFGLNGVTSSTPMPGSDHILFSLSGPAVTVLGAVAAFLWLRRTQSLIAYAVIYFAFFMRLAATVVSVFNPNDEARASALLGWGAWTLPTIVVLGLATLTVMASRALRLSWRVNVGAYGVCSLVVTLIVGLDMMLRS